MSPPEMWQAGCRRQSNDGFQGDSERSVLHAAPNFCSQTKTHQWVQFAHIASGENTPHQFEPNLQLHHSAVLQPEDVDTFSNLIKSNQQTKSLNTEAANKNRIIQLQAELSHQQQKIFSATPWQFAFYMCILKANLSMITLRQFFIVKMFLIINYLANRLAQY